VIRRLPPGYFRDPFGLLVREQFSFVVAVAVHV
jgi:hypothetical protein